MTRKFVVCSDAKCGDKRMIWIMRIWCKTTFTKLRTTWVASVEEDLSEEDMDAGGAGGGFGDGGGGGTSG